MLAKETASENQQGLLCVFTTHSDCPHLCVISVNQPLAMSGRRTEPKIFPAVKSMEKEYGGEGELMEEGH